MKEQNFKNHKRYVAAYHFVTPIILIAVVVSSLINLCQSGKDNWFPVFLIIALTVAVLILWAYSRRFALKAQDRAIRAEENFRHFIATGNPLDERLGIGQIVALRFAGDEEFVALVKRAAEENLSSTDIKKAILHWKADLHRV
jgi:hypothetical protein